LSDPLLARVFVCFRHFGCFEYYYGHLRLTSLHFFQSFSGICLSFGNARAWS
jgi:hypothetical protein